MEDSFRVRVDKAFGALISTQSPTNPSPTSTAVSSSLWCLTDEELDRSESNRKKQLIDEEEEEEDFGEIKPEKVSFSKEQVWDKDMEHEKGFDFRCGMENDLEDLEDEDEDDLDGEAQKGKPDCYGDEEWKIKNAIGRDCTLDYEEEEDEYDKVAVGKKNKVELEDRLYMKDVNDYDIHIDSGHGLFMRDLRANHAAAMLRIKEDAESAKKMGSLHVAEKELSSLSSSSLVAADGNLKSILKRKDNGLDSKALGSSSVEPKLQDKQLDTSKSQKRVRFDPECKDGHQGDESKASKDEGMETDSVDEGSMYHLPPDYPSGIPDYMRNPTKYTRYDFDSSSDIDDKSNRGAYMDFLEMIKKSKSDNNPELQSDEVSGDLPKSLVFIPKKKSNDGLSRANLNEAKENINGAKSIPGKDLPVGIAANNIQDSETSPMEEDDPSGPSADTKSGHRGQGRRYRTKGGLETDEAV